jgi:AAA domain
MKLIFLYGSPAAGKLTVANEIAKRTDFKVFHNHLSIDCVTPVFEFGSPPFERMIALIRKEMVAEAARAGRNMVYTFCYAKDIDDNHVEMISRAAEENGGEVCFVQLLCDKEVLKQRVLGESRRQYGKVKSIEMMDHFFETYDLFSPVPNRETLQIDNTGVPPDQAAELIIAHYGLKEKGAN